MNDKKDPSDEVPEPEQTEKTEKTESGALHDPAADEAQDEQNAEQDDLRQDDLRRDADADSENLEDPGNDALTDADQEMAAQTADEESVPLATASANEDGADRDQKDQPEAATKPPRTGRVLAAIALLLAFVGLGGVGYLYYLLVHSDPTQNLVDQQDLQATQRSVQGLEQALRETNQAQTQALDAFAAQQADRLKTTEEGVLASLQQALQAAPPSQREWKLAEAEYLMRIANHRALMEQDSQGALDLLIAADAVMSEMDDFALHEIRARLADEIIALRQVRKQDLQGIYLRLEALKGQLDMLSVNVDEYQQQAEPEVEQTVWQQISEQLAQFVRVRDLSGSETLKPLMAPQQEAYLELNMRLALEQAQLAALKRQQAVYEHALENLRTWFETYMDERAQPLIDEINELMLLDLQATIPDISSSLNALLQVRRGAG